ncbi:MAG: zinc-binding dehydrogenase [Candidatus Heimdallarchaeota archaeon]
MIPSKMKAGLMYGPGDVRIEMVPTPKPEDNGVLIRVEAVGICATDVKKYIGLSSVSFPIILGHEFAGTIVSMGKNVNGYKIGEKVSANPDIPCFQCKYCIQSKYNLCTQLSVIGYGTEEIEPINGAFAQYVKVPTWNLIRLQHSITFEEATFIEPFACVIRSFNQGRVSISDEIVILGDGRIGLLHIQLAREYGVKGIYVTGLSDNRLAIARELGVKSAINVQNTDPVDFISKVTYDGADVVFDTTGSVPAAEQGVQMLAPHGRFVSFAGFPKSQSSMKINPRDLHYKEITLTGSFGYGSLMDYYLAEQLINSRKIDVDILTTYTRPLDDLEKGLKEIAELKSIRTILKPNMNS